MTTLRQIIIDALREANVVAVGETPDADVHAEALRRLQNIIRSLFGNELGEQLRTLDDEDLEGAEHLPVNARIVFNLGAAKTWDMYDNPRDGARFAVIDNGGNFATYNLTLNGNNRQIELADSVTLNTDAVNREWFYRADLGNWARVTDLTANDESPLPSEFDDYLITLLAYRLNPRYGAESSPTLVDTLTRMKRQFRARYRQEHEQDSEDALLLLPSNYRYYLGYSDDFYRGRLR